MPCCCEFMTQGTEILDAVGERLKRVIPLEPELTPKFIALLEALAAKERTSFEPTPVERPPPGSNRSPKNE